MYAQLFAYAVPVACVAWTVTQEEVFREIRTFCVGNSKTCKHLLQRKFFYLFTCEYCFSHYVALLVVWLSGFRVLDDGVLGAAFAVFSLVWVANVYMSAYCWLRLQLKHTRAKIVTEEEGPQRKNHDRALKAS